MAGKRSITPGTTRRPARVPAAVKRELRTFFRRNGYARFQNPDRCAEEGAQQYKKGDEIRLIAASKGELRTIRRLLVEAGFKPGSPFAKGYQYAQPVYGREAVARFLDMVD